MLVIRWLSMKLMPKRTRGWCPVSRREGLVARAWLQSMREPEAFWQTWGSTRPRCCPSCGQSLGVRVGPVLPTGLRETTFKEYCTGLGKQTLGGHKQNLVCTRTQRLHRDWARTVFECLLWRYGSAVDCHRGSVCSRPRSYSLWHKPSWRRSPLTLP